MKKLIILAVALVVLGAAAWFLAQRNDGNRAPAKNAVQGTKITYTDEGFTPTSLKAAPGSPITIRNDSSSELQFSSDPHPIHTDNSDLNAKKIAPGESTTIIITKAGTWGFHNHLQSGAKGTITIE